MKKKGTDEEKSNGFEALNNEHFQKFSWRL